jgi:outer membrane protein TolC
MARRAFLTVSEFLSYQGDAMKHRNQIGLRSSGLLVGLCLLALVQAAAEPLPLKRAVELALTHATATGIAAADEQHALQSYRELHNNYIPQVTVGSGLGKSWGYPLSLEGAAPSLFNTTAQSAVFNPALREFLRSARAEWQATTNQSKDQRNAVIQDTVLSYAELGKWEERTARFQQEQAAAKRFEDAIGERVKEGVDSPLEGIKARLATARVTLRFAEAQGSADVLREHLSRLTGLPGATIETVKDSVPAFPALPQDEDLKTSVEKTSYTVQSAVDHARAQYLRAKGEHKALWPTLDFAAQYALLATFNNYDRFFQPNSFEANNATVGVAIRFPFFNASQRAHARAADAEAEKARRQAEAAKNQVSEETLKLQRAVRQLEAAQEVAKLEYEIAQSNLESAQTRMDAGTATVKDLGDARAQASERYIALQDTTFELQRARVGLMRSTGDLEKWINGFN